MKGKKERVILPPEQSDDLLLPFPKQVQATFRNNTIKIGPVIGLMTEIHPNYKTIFHEILQSEDYTNHYCFVFSPFDIDLDSGTVVGRFLDWDEGERRWHKHTVPIPDVIYNRITYRSAERSSEVKSLFKRIHEDGEVKLFNPHFFSKQTIHKLLQYHPVVKEYLPETRFSATKRTIKQLLQKHDEIFIKPKDGTEGLGIYKITKAGMGYTCHTERQIIHYDSLSLLLNNITATEKARRYVVQQGIHLIQYNGRNIDFRVNMNKNIQNNWVVSGIAAKAAGAESVTTHVRLGGRVYTCNDILTRIFEDEAQKVRNKIEFAAIDLAIAIEEGIGKPVGELGLDIGIAKDGRVWMFEANSKPGRSIFKFPGLEEEGVHSLNLLYEYAYYLAGFGEQEPS
ncbi:YheC/YheD family protein [Neobacillus notoginsengisoli]|uniref:YheC/YheD family endospore coat-associated protein n=1 Tax=Neobacillus notoginsengisoli TaxID=1578198 RepID=UPI0013147CE0|nr:YheC/YheD family protein [Neobacillus notoginsengisoli]